MSESESNSESRVKAVLNDDLLAVLAPVLDWYQSDEHPERPPLDILRDIVADLQSDRKSVLENRTPNASLPPLDPESPKRRMLVEIEVAANFEKRLDNQWMVEREIDADRWSWQWADSHPDKLRLDFLCNLPTAQIQKQYSTQRGAHWPWTISIGGNRAGWEHDDFRAAVDDAMKREPTWIPMANSELSPLPGADNH